MLEAALDGMVALLAADRASVLVFGDDRRAHFVAWRGLSERYRAAIDGDSPWTPEEVDAQPIAYADLASAGLAAELAETIAAEGIASLAFFPLPRRDQLLGKFMVYFDRPHPLSAAEIHLGKVVAVHVAASLGRLLDHEELQRREERLRSLIDNSLDVVVVLDSEARPLLVSRSIERVLGYSPRELLGRTVSELTHPDDRERALAEFARVLADPGFEGPVELRILHKTGETRHFEARARNLLTHPSVGGVVLNLRDVTDRYRAKEALDLQRSYFRLLFEHSPLAVVIADLEERVQEVNSAFERLFGYRRSEVLGRFINDLVVPTERGKEAAALSRRVTDGEATALVDTVRRRQDGTLFAAAVRGYPIALAGRPIGVLATYEDVSERRRAQEALRASEERYRKIFETSRDPIFVASPEGRLLDLNPAGRQLFGLELGATAPALEALDWRPADGGQAFARLLTDGFVNELEFETQARDSRRLRLQLTAAVETDETGRPLAVRGILRDVTAQRALEEQLRQAQKMEAVGRLAGGVAHDFNNLLTAINGYSELLLGRFTDGEPARHEAEEILRAGRRAAELTRQLLALSRRQVLSPRRLDFDRAIADMERLLRRVLGEDLELAIALTAERASIRCDPGQLEQVVLNLAVNARDAMPHGGRLEIATRRLELDAEGARRHLHLRPGSYVELIIRDNGLGMEPQVLEHIFEPFFTTKEHGKGTGLGLSTVYGIVRQSGGDIDVASRPGEGTTVTVLLPTVAGPAESEEGLAETARGPGQGTVLLVEDEQAVRRLLALTLREAGFAVLEAGDGREALELARQHHARLDLLLTDLVMPNLSGPGLAARLLSERPRLPVVYMSGYAVPSEEFDASAQARRHFLQKPFPTATLVRTVREAIEEAAAEGAMDQRPPSPAP